MNNLKVKYVGKIKTMQYNFKNRLFYKFILTIYNFRIIQYKN